MNTKILEYIIAIAEEGSISQAAERFYLSQPVLSRHLKKVEAELGAPLFLRDPHHLTLTDAGIIFINNAQAILHAKRQMELKLEDMRRSQKESLTLLAEPYYLNFFVKKILPLFHEKHPDFSLCLSPANIHQARQRLASQEADLAVFTSRHLQDKDLELLPLFSDELLFVLPQGDSALPAIAHGIRRPDALKNHVFCLHSSDTAFRLMENEWLDSIGLHPMTVLETDSFRFALDWVCQRQCCAFIPKARLRSANMSTLQAFPHVPPVTFYQVLAYPKNVCFKHAAHDLMQIISEQFAAFERYVESAE